MLAEAYLAQKMEAPCPICDKHHYKILIRAKQEINDPIKLYGAASGVRGTQTLVKCLNCNMIFESPRFSEEVILKGYRAAEDMGHDSQYALRVNSFFKALMKMAPCLPRKGATVLDIGSAGGAFLEAAKLFGYNPIGLEPSAYLATRASGRGFDVRQNTIHTSTFEKEQFDMICLWDVLEHLVNPKRDLEIISQYLKPNGILLINFPDIGTFMARLTGRHFWWIISVHLHHFTKKTISKLFHETGYMPIKFFPYRQRLEFGYLQNIAIQLRVLGMKWLKKVTPSSIKRFPISYSASQTTVLAKKIIK